MNSYDFKSLRRYVNHDLIRNGFLYRFGVPGDFFSAKDDHEREGVLTTCLESVSESAPKNLQVAAATWKGDGHRNQGIEALVIELHSRAKSLKHVRTTAEYPHEEQVRMWLQVIREYVTQTESIAALPLEERRGIVLKTSRAIRQLCDFLSALDVDSPHYWRLFTPDDQ